MGSRTATPTGLYVPGVSRAIMRIILVKTRGTKHLSDEKLVVGLCGAGPHGDAACPGKTPGPVRQMDRALIIAATPRKVAACSRWRAYTLKAVRPLSEPPADMHIFLSNSLACAPWRPPASWQMGMDIRFSS